MHSLLVKVTVVPISLIVQRNRISSQETFKDLKNEKIIINSKCNLNQFRHSKQ